MGNVSPAPPWGKAVQDACSESGDEALRGLPRSERRTKDEDGQPDLQQGLHLFGVGWRNLLRGDGDASVMLAGCRGNEIDLAVTVIDVGDNVIS